MPFAPSSPVTGATVTGLTSPTYTLTADLAPTPLGKQYAISALGGTQTGVQISAVSKPFTVNFVRPASFKYVAKPDPITGVLTRTSQNTWKLITRKGIVPLSGQSPQIMLITTTFDVPAGGESVEPEDLAAAVSLHVGVLSAGASGMVDSFIAGTV